MLLPSVEEPADVAAVVDVRPAERPLLAHLRDGRAALVLVALVASVGLQILWYTTLSGAGGDAAAQDAWAQFARAFPGSAYDLAWYGGMHPSSYSVVSPYIMAALGVRTTMLLASVVCGVLLAVLVTQVYRPGWTRYAPVAAGILAFLANATSGRVTFALGTAFGLGALCLLLALRDRPGRGWVLAGRAGVALLSLLSTAASPVSGLFLGLVAAALWLRSRRVDAYVIGIPPVLVVAGSAVLFPFSGVQPMPWYSVILPVSLAIGAAALAPARWQEVRVTAVVYVITVLLVWAVHSPIGTNVTRLGLVFGGVVLVAALLDKERVTSHVAKRWGERIAVGALVAGVLTSTIWQVALSGRDLAHARTPKALASAMAPVIQELKARQADRSRIEVVPMRSHAEAAAFASELALARGWNRQADVARNPVFYDDDALDVTTYHEWLKTWAVGFVVISNSAPDRAGAAEAALVRSGLPYLREVWHDDTWRIYQVKHATPLVSRPGKVVGYDAARLTLWVPEAGRYVIRIAYSPWLTLVDANGGDLASSAPSEEGGSDAATDETAPQACLTEQRPDPEATGDDEDDATKPAGWVVLHAPASGVYRLAAPYRVGGRAACP